MTPINDDVYELSEDNDVIEIADDRASVQADLVATYQAALARAGGDPAQVDADGARALDALVRDVLPLLQSIAVSEVSKRFGETRPGTVLEDCHAAGVEEVIKLAATFDPAKCPKFHWVVSAKRGDVRGAMRDVVDASHGLGPLPKEHRRVARRARGIRVDFIRDHDREPTLEELQAAVTEYYMAQQRRNAPATMSAGEREQLAEQRLVRSGIRAAIADLGTLMKVTEAQPMPDGVEGGWTTVAENLSDGDALNPHADHTVIGAVEHEELTAFERVATANLSPLERQAVLARLVGTDDPDHPGPWTFVDIADRFRIPTGTVRDLIAASRARLSSPHVQFAHLAPGLEQQFEVAAAPASSAAAALGRRFGRGVAAAA